MPGICRQCFNHNATSKCGGCKRVFYCNTNCQAKHWFCHKRACKIWRRKEPQSLIPGTLDYNEHFSIARGERRFEWPEPRAKIVQVPNDVLGTWHYLYYKPKDAHQYFILIVAISGIFLYDDETKHVSSFAPIPKEMHLVNFMAPCNSGAFIDTLNDRLYLFSTSSYLLWNAKSSDHQFKSNHIITLDLQTKKWNVIEDALTPSDAWSDGIYHPTFHFVNGTAHIVYLDSQTGHHEIFDFKSNTFHQLANDASQLTTCMSDSIISNRHYPAHCVYIKPLNKLIAVASNTVWSLAFNQDELEDSAKWEKEGISWPDDRFLTNIENSAMVVGFECIIYIFAINVMNQMFMEIWCLDLLDRKWYKSEKRVPGYLMMEEDSVTHCGYLSTGGRYAHYYRWTHDKIDLYDVSPIGLKLKIEQRMRKTSWNTLVFGYIRTVMEQKEEWNCSCNDLQSICLQYYSVF
eukprot:241827_1